MAYKSKIKISVDYDDKATKLWADERRLKQILVNLLSNAIKFTPEGGNVGIDVSSSIEKQALSFTMWDTGIGIKQEDMGKLFKPFIQLDSRLAREYSGTGLGLSLVYRLTEMHGGSVSVESEIGTGSRFTITLPWSPVVEQPSSNPEALKEQSIAPIFHHEPSLKILLAEDNEANIETISGYLDAYGYKVITARDGIEAIEQAKSQRPNLILMDVQMPQMDGLEAIRRLRAEPESSNTPIVALTALAMPNDKERCLAAGANEYLSKPVSLAILSKVIEKQLNHN